MQISERTITILKNFTKINGSIVVDPGSMLWTGAWPGKNLFARATTAEEFDVPFALFDLGEFLSLASLVEEPDFEFKEKKVIIKGGKQKAQYTYAERSLIPAVPKKIKDIEPLFSAPVSKKDIASLIEASNVLKCTDIVFKTADGKATATAKNATSSTSHEFVLPLGETSAQFDFKVEKDLFRMIPDDYTLIFGDKPLLKMASNDITYWLAASI